MNKNKANCNGTKEITLRPDEMIFKLVSDPIRRGLTLKKQENVNNWFTCDHIFWSHVISRIIYENISNYGIHPEQALNKSLKH